ncbi:MAG: serine protein kinase, partial [Steroidobacteraceae bacterium]
MSDSTKGSAPRGENFVDALSAYSRVHRAKHWSGTFGEFLRTVVPGQARALARTSHEYLWDMFCWYGRTAASESDTASPKELFRRELFGIDEPLGRIVDYFKAAASGSDVGRRLLLLLGPPSGGKSTMAILLKRGLEEYSHTDEGAVYALQGSPMHESPLNLIPASLRAEFRETYGVDVRGELSPWARDRLEREFEGDFLRMPVERVFLSEAARVGVGTYAPHDPTTA